MHGHACVIISTINPEIVELSDHYGFIMVFNLVSSVPVRQLNHCIISVLNVLQVYKFLLGENVFLVHLLRFTVHPTFSPRT